MLRKILLPVLWLVALVLAACQAAPTAAPATLTSTPRPSPTPAPTREPGCTVVSKMSESAPAQESIYAPVSDADWVRGADDAAVTIIEYSDFQ